jgi:hypothetical protein
MNKDIKQLLSTAKGVIYVIDWDWDRCFISSSWEQDAEMYWHADFGHPDWSKGWVLCGFVDSSIKRDFEKGYTFSAQEKILPLKTLEEIRYWKRGLTVYEYDWEAEEQEAADDNSDSWKTEMGW